jgi:hypothetical protein
MEYFRPPTTPTYTTDDRLWKGDVLADSKPPDTTRILFHNIRGMKVDQTTTLDILSHDQDLLTVDLQGISEHQLDTNQQPLVSDLQTNVCRSYPGQITLQIDSSVSSAVNTYKPGGTAIIVVGNIVGCLESGGKGRDPMGRWSYLHLCRRDMPPLTVISAYQVCPHPTNPKGNTAWHQQRLALNLASRHHTHPRKAFVDDLLKTIQQFQRQNHDIILGGDFNETLDAPNSGILKIAASCNLTDPWLLRHPGHGPFKTQATGSKQIDSVLLSHRFLDSVRSIGYAPFGFITNSDHRPLLLDFHTQRLFGDEVDMMPPPQLRGVKSNDRQSVTTYYIERLYRHLTNHNAFALQAALDDPHDTLASVETADKIFSDGSEAADNSCKRRRPEFYSLPLVQQRLKASALAAHLADLRFKKESRLPALQARLTRAAADLDTIPAELTMADFQGKIKAWKETTSTSPSGRHLGRYKALFGKNKYDRNEDEYMYTELLQKQKAIASFVLSIINFCIRAGHVLE